MSSSTITVTAEGAYQGNVTLLIAETYDSIDISVHFTPQVLQLNSTHPTVNSLASISVSQLTVPGSYMIDVEAYDGIAQHSSQISLMVTGQDFSISASPSRIDVPTGQNKTLDATVSVTSIGGFSGSVSLTVTVSSSYPQVPMLPNATLSANTVTISPSSPASLQLAISVDSSIVAHQYSIEVDGIGPTTAGVLRLSVVTVVVGADFNISLQTSNLVVHQGSIKVATLTFTSINGYVGTIAAYSGLISVNPPNPDIQLYPSSPSLLPGGTNSSLIVVKTDSRTGIGTYHVAIEADDGPYGGHLGGGLAYTVTVEGPATGPDFTMHADPVQLSAGLGAIVNSTI
ncbi:MAG TPA: hypothetical protein VFV92_05355, partial [Candidatus Bathyarchaeia archaeon]|nr:hypothetical protein [Candidatus Bathyarchaeia archaeon]